MKFYLCKSCGNMVALVHEGGGQLVCCGSPMTEVLPNSTEAAKEKHVPVVVIQGNEVVVKVGEVSHPMEEAHHIEWIMIETKMGRQRKVLGAGAVPAAEFSMVDGDEFVAAYAYCNLHGLWKS
ncbi:MAG: desulfoferrodoxin FeS4 iron-binding domain-containing protein [Lachnospiraceae bacterium]|jgi:superoxide reductase|nr:desulfoferrodoxin FeS4 iron-binding domain-containing protein [Lachnospiraceae bacterium]MCI1726291.1 desulfoferrodoxin FeS4 iron-binding domain-containing protein [Lachnospiraceae bacterium]